MLKRLLFILVVSTISVQAQTTVTPVNGTTQVFTTLELNRNLNAVPVFSLNRTLIQPVLVNPGFMQRTTIIVERTPFLNQPLTPAINTKPCDTKVERPFVPTYIHLNLNRNEIQTIRSRRQN